MVDSVYSKGYLKSNELLDAVTSCTTVEKESDDVLNFQDYSSREATTETHTGRTWIRVRFR